jgi:hypothetical protein
VGTVILEYAAGAGAVLIGAGAVVLAVVLVRAGRTDDEGVFDPAELAAVPAELAAVPAELAAVPAGLVAPADLPAPGSGGQPPCPNPGCRGRHCSTWRRRAIPCSDQHATVELPVYAAGLPLPRDGRHSASAALVRWLAGDWWDAPLPVRLRRQLGRLAGTTRVPVQHGSPLGRLP